MYDDELQPGRKTGLLINEATKLHRNWFKECVKLIGTYVYYKAPKETKHYTLYSEIETDYENPILIGCLFHQYPDQKTLKKIGWVSELQESASIIEVQYDLPNLQQGALFIVPAGVDTGTDRVFRVVSMQTSAQFPATVACEIIPEYEDTFSEVSDLNYSDKSFSVLNKGDSEETTTSILTREN